MRNFWFLELNMFYKWLLFSIALLENIVFSSCRVFWGYVFLYITLLVTLKTHCFYDLSLRIWTINVILKFDSWRSNRTIQYGNCTGYLKNNLTSVTPTFFGIIFAYAKGNLNYARYQQSFSHAAYSLPWWPSG